VSLDFFPNADSLDEVSDNILINGIGDWELFQSTFYQTCYFVGKPFEFYPTP